MVQKFCSDRESLLSLYANTLFLFLCIWEKTAPIPKSLTLVSKEKLPLLRGLVSAGADISRGTQFRG